MTLEERENHIQTGISVIIVALSKRIQNPYHPREINRLTIRNYFKVAKLLDDMNDIAKPWKRITRPQKGKQLAGNKMPSRDEI
jgi:hypothetical protein